MRAVVLDRPGQVTVRHIDAPVPGERALVRVAQAGLCGTDLKIAAGEIPVALPRVLGHEMTGWVDRAGARGLLAAGTPVLVNPAVFCGHCALCRRDLPQLCQAGGLLGRDADGVFADLVAVDETCLHPLPPGLPADGAALLQVLSTCVHAQSLLTAGPAGSAVVVGLGVSGLLHVQLLRDRGVPVIVGVTRSAAKRELARHFGATAVAGPGDAADAVAAHTGGRGADLAIETAGNQHALGQAMRLAAPGGTVLVYGTTATADGLPTYDWYLKELTIRGTRAARPRDCDLAIRLYADRRVDLAPLVTARFPVGQAAQALAACAEPGQLKVVLDVAGQPP
jgi:threonine dehydrogenase-like Zn-dependent dehydrogenase